MQKNQKNSKKLIWGPFQVPFGPKTQKSFRSIVSLYAQKIRKGLDPNFQNTRKNLFWVHFSPFSANNLKITFFTK